MTALLPSIAFLLRARAEGAVGSERRCVKAGTSNFSTPADDGRGRMQMYLFPGPVPDRSSGLDHEVLIHERTHGTSNRLHGNAAGLNTTLSGGLGEGWSVRRFPYAVISSLGINGRPCNPLTFADIDAGHINTTDGAYPRSPVIGNTAFEVHNIGDKLER